MQERCKKSSASKRLSHARGLSVNSLFSISGFAYDLAMDDLGELGWWRGRRNLGGGLVVLGGGDGDGE